MEAKNFTNYYEVLGLGYRASFGAITVKFRHLARRYHPDNSNTGDRSQFDAVVNAHDVLKDPARRAQYHDDNPDHLPPFLDFGEGEEHSAEAGSAPEAVESELHIDGLGIEQDLSIQNNLLLLLYVRRRRNIREPGIGNAELERLSGCPPEHLEFHIWYMRAKGWIATGEDGLLAITIDGVERAAAIYRETAHRLITDLS